MLDGSKYQQARTVLNYSWIILLVAVAKANIDISTGEITIATTSSTTSITTKPFVYIHDVSYEADNSTYDFQLTLSAAEILNLSAIRQDVDFQNSSTLYLLPSAEFSYCVDTNQATGLDARVEIKQDGTAGFADGNSVINAYAVLAGNGSATGGNQEILFGSDSFGGISTIKTVDVTGNISNASSAFSNNSLVSLTKVGSNSSTWTALDHYYIPAGNYSFTKTSATTRSDTAFVYDQTDYESNSDCAGGLVKVNVFMNADDIITRAAGHYTGSVKIILDTNGA